MVIPEEHIRRFTVEEVLRLVELEILGEDERVELRNGLLVVMMAQGPRHSYAVTKLRERLVDAYGNRVCVREEKPMVTGEHDLRVPDVAVVRGTQEAYLDRHPRGEDALLVVEVADAGYDDAREKVAVYARAGVPLYWIVNIPDSRIEVFSQPLPNGTYRMTRELAGEDRLSLPRPAPSAGAGPAEGAGVTWAAGDLLPPRTTGGDTQTA